MPSCVGDFFISFSELENPLIYVHTGRRSERSLYIVERAQSMHGLTRGEMLQMYCRDQRGVCVPYQEKDLRYGITQGYLWKEGAGQVMKGGVLHRGLVGASKRGRGRGGVGGWKKGRRQAVVRSREQGEAGRPTQAQKRSRESPARMEKRAQQRERPVTPTQALRPAPDISKKMRPKNRDKEG